MPCKEEGLRLSQQWYRRTQSAGAACAGTQHKPAHPTHTATQHEAPVQQHNVKHSAVEQLHREPLHAADLLHELLGKQLVVASGQQPAVTDDDVLLDVLVYVTEALQASKLVCQELSSDTLIQLLHDARRVCNIQTIQKASQHQLARSRAISAFEALLLVAQPVLRKATCSQMIAMIDDIQHLQGNLPEDWCWAELLCDAASRTEDRFLATCNVPQLMVFTQQLTALEPDLLQVLESEQLHGRIRAAVDRLVRAQRGIPKHSQQLTITASKPSSSTLPPLLTDLPWSHAEVQGSVLSADEMIQLAYMCLTMTTQGSPPERQQWVVQLCYSAIGVKTGHQDAGVLVTLCTALLQHNLAPLAQTDVQQQFISSMCETLIRCEALDQEAARGSKPVTSGSRFYPALGDPGFLQLLQLLISKSRLTAGRSFPVTFYGALVSHMRHVDIHDDLHSHIAAELRHIITSAVFDICSTEDAASMQPVAAALLTHWQQYAARLLAEATTDELLQLPQLAEIAGHNMQAGGFQDRWEQQVLKRISINGRLARQYQQRVLQQVLLPMWRTHQQLPHSIQLMELCLADAKLLAQQLTTDELTAIAMRLVNSPGTHNSSAVSYMKMALYAAAERCTAEGLPGVLQAASRLTSVMPKTTATAQQQEQDWAGLLSRVIPKHISSWTSHQCCVLMHIAVLQLHVHLPAPCIDQLIQPFVLARPQDCSLDDVLQLLKVLATRTCLAQLDPAVTVEVLQCCTATIMQPAASFLQQYTALQCMAQLGTTAVTLWTLDPADIQRALQASASSLQAGLLATFPAKPVVNASQQLVSLPGMLLGMGTVPPTDWCQTFETTSLEALPQVPAQDLVVCFLSLHQAGYQPSWQWLHAWAGSLAPHTQQLEPHTATRLLGILHQRLVASRDQLNFHSSWYGSQDVPPCVVGIMQLLRSISLSPIGIYGTVPVSELCHALAAAASRQVAGADNLSFILEGNTASMHPCEQPPVQCSHKEGQWVHSCCDALRWHLRRQETALPATAADTTVAEDLARAAGALLTLRLADGFSPAMRETVIACLAPLAVFQDTETAPDSSSSSSSFRSAVDEIPISTLEVLLQACIQRKVDVPAQVWEMYQSRSRQQGALAWARSLLLLQQAGRSVTAEDLRQVARAMANEKQHDVELAEKLLVLAQMQRVVWSDVCALGVTWWHALALDTNSDTQELSMDHNDSALQPDVQKHFLSWQNACGAATSAAAAVAGYLTSCSTAIASFQVSIAAAPAYVSAQVANIQLQHAAALVVGSANSRAQLSKQKLVDLLQEQDEPADQLRLAVAITFKGLEQGFISMLAANDAQAAAMWCDVLWVAAIINTHTDSGDIRAQQLRWPLQQPLDPDLVHPVLLQAASYGQPLIAGDLLSKLALVTNHFMPIRLLDASLPSAPDDQPYLNVDSAWVQHFLKLAVFAATAHTVVPPSELSASQVLVARQLAQIAVTVTHKPLSSDQQQQLLLDTATVTCGQPLLEEDYAKLQGCLSEETVLQLLSDVTSYLQGAIKSSPKLSQAARQRLLDVVDAACALVVRNYAQPYEPSSLDGLSPDAQKQVHHLLQQLQLLDPQEALKCSCNPYLRLCTMILIYVHGTSTPRVHDSLAAGLYAALATEMQDRPWCTPVRQSFQRAVGLAAATRGDISPDLQSGMISSLAKIYYMICMEQMFKAQDYDIWLAVELLYSQYVRLRVDRPMGVALQANMHTVTPLAGDLLDGYDDSALPTAWICLNITRLSPGKYGATWLITAPAVEHLVQSSLANIDSWELADPQQLDGFPSSTGASISWSYKNGGRFIGSKYGRVWRLSLLYGMTLHTPGVDKDLVQDCKQRFLDEANAACNNQPPPPVEAVLTWTAPWLVPAPDDKPATLPLDMPIQSWLNAADWSRLVGPEPDPIQLLQLQTLCFTCPEFYQLMKSVQHSEGALPAPGTHRLQWVYAQTMQAVDILLECMKHIMPSAAGGAGSWTVAEQLAAALRLQLEVVQQRKTLLECDAEELHQLCLRVRSVTPSELFKFSAHEVSAAAMRRAIEVGTLRGDMV